MSESFPSEHGALSPLPSASGRVLHKIAIALALGGGLVFVALMAMSLVSIVGRKLFNQPLQGDVELMQIGAAVGTAAFLPLCALMDQHIKVDALSGWMSRRVRSGFDSAAHCLMCLMAALLTWRTALAAIDTRGGGELSTLLLIPQWIPVAALVPSLALLCICCAYRAYWALADGRDAA